MLDFGCWLLVSGYSILDADWMQFTTALWLVDVEGDQESRNKNLASLEFIFNCSE